MKKLICGILLFISALIWGITFVAQSDASAHIEPFTFNFVRFLIGSAVLLPFIPIFGRFEAKKAANSSAIDSAPAAHEKSSSKKLLVGGVLLGIMLCIASNLQQLGITNGDSVGKAGFITSVYIMLVPVVGLFFRKKTHPLIWLCTVVSAVGLYFLSVDPARGAFNIEFSDLAYLGCAVFFAVQIILVSIYSPQVNCIALSCIQFAVAAVFSGIGMLFFETPSFAAILNAAGPLLYAGILSCGIAYTLQVIGQRGIDPAIASLIMCLESVFSVIAGFLLLNQRMTPREILGCGIMFAATVAAQLIPSTQKKNSRN